MRLVLAFLLLSGALPARAADAPPDPLAVIITQLAAPLDEQAESASAPKAENSERLAKIQSSLTVAAAGFESLRAPSHAFAAKEALEAKTDPALKPFIKNRDASLNAIYRTLAVVDYTWALRFPNPACSPTERRRALLQSADGLFIDPDVATLSPWMARLLGPNSFGRAPEEALDRAAAATKLTPSAYEKVRVRASQITETIGSVPAGGRAALYCERAGLYEQLANAHRAENGPTLAALATGSDDAASAAGLVFLVAAPNGNDYDALGAGFLVATKNGQKFVTDASIVRGRKKIYAFAHPASDGKLGRPMAVTIEHAAKGTGPAVGRFEGENDFPALALAVASPAADELVRGLGPLREAGPWTVTQGLVTGISATTFQSDAVLSAEMAGAPVLNDRGEAAGLIIRNGGDATALKVEDLRDFLDAEKPEASDAEFVASRNSGSASLLTTMRPVEAYGWSAPGASAIESGLPGNLGGVNWDGGGGVGGFRSNAPATPSYSYNWQKSTGYSDGGSAERIGNSIGAPLGDAIGKLIVFGMQKLFRGIYSIFHPQPGSGGSDGAVAVKREKPAPPPPPPPPPPEPKITGLTVSVSPADALPGQRVTVTGQLQFQGDYKNKSGITISFGADGKRAFFGDAGGSSAKGTTDSGGHASVVLTLAEDVQRTASAEFDSLDRETSHQRNANPAPHAVANATPTRKVKDAASAAVGALEAESDQDSSSPEPDAQADETEPEDSPATIDASPISVTASALKFSASAQIKTAAKPYYKLVIKAAPNKINSGDHATVTARIITNDKNFVKSGVPINFEFTMNGAQPITATVNTNNSGIAEIDVESVGQSLNVAASAGGTANAPTEAGDKFNSPICTLFGAATIAIQATPAVLAASAAGAAAAPVALAAAAPVMLPALGAGLVVMTGCYVLINGVPQKPQPMAATGDGNHSSNGNADAMTGQSGDPNHHFNDNDPDKKSRTPDLGRKLDYLFGKATGDEHNLERTRQMLAQMERIGLPDNIESRQIVENHLESVLNDSSNISRVQENGRIVKESILSGPRGTVKLETIWDADKLITINVFGG